MKQNLKFLLALGGAKLVLVNDGRRDALYGHAATLPAAKKTDLKRIAATLSARV